MTTFAANQSRFAHSRGWPRSAGTSSISCSASPLGIAFFSFAVTGLSLAAGLAITLLGIPVLLATLLASRWIARGRARPRRARRRRADRGRSPAQRWGRRALEGDPARPHSWTGVAWSLLLLPIGTGGFTVAVTLWSTTLGFVTSPLWYWAVPQDDDTIPLLDSTSAGYTVLRVLIGLALLPTTAMACRAMAAGTGRLARAILG